MGRHSAVVLWSVVIATTIVAGRADAAKLVVMAVDSGADITAPYANLPPLLTPGAKGFLLGIDTEDGDTVVPLGVQDIHIAGSGLINRLVQSPSEGLLPYYPRIVSRSQAAPYANEDQIDYRRDGTYLMDQTQATPQGDRTWMPVGPGLVAGLGFFDITASFGLPSTSVGGVRPLVYVVTTSDLTISGFIARYQQGFGMNGGSELDVARLDFNAGTLVGDPTPRLPPPTFPQDPPPPVAPLPPEPTVEPPNPTGDPPSPDPTVDPQDPTPLPPLVWPIDGLIDPIDFVGGPWILPVGGPTLLPVGGSVDVVDVTILPDLGILWYPIYTTGAENGSHTNFATTAFFGRSDLAIPEPSTFCLAASALGACAIYARYRVRRASRLRKPTRRP